MENDYRTFLKEELLNRCRVNSAYSVRAFARDLEVTPGFLSKLLRGQKNLSEGRAHSFAGNLKWEKEKQKVFTSLVRFEAADSDVRKKGVLSDLELYLKKNKKPMEFFDLKEDTFKAISDWHHFAILELSEIAPEGVGLKWYAEKLELSELEVDLSVRRLQRLKLLKVLKSGQLVKLPENYVVGDVPSQAIQEYHRQVLEKAKTALTEQSVEERYFTGISMAVNENRLQEAREKIQKFREEMMDLLEEGERSAVYQLGIQLFRVDKKD